LAAHSGGGLAAVTAALNAKRCKTLNWRTLAKALEAVLRSAQTDVAMTN
jgi:hypothetical protein